MNGKSCFFIGSRYSSDEIIIPLTQSVEKHITEYGVTHFTVGLYGNFDKMVQGVLCKAKKQHEHIHNYLLFPYALNQKGVEIPNGFDCFVYPDGLEKVPFRFAIVQANRFTVKYSDYLIAHQGIGNSRKIIEYAQSREKRGLIKVFLL